MKTKQSRQEGESFSPASELAQSASDVEEPLPGSIFNCALDALDGNRFSNGKSFWSAKNRRNH